MGGSPDPHYILEVLGIEPLAEYLVSENQEVYRLQGVKINDKHIEVIVRQMLQKVEITHAGDTILLPGEQIDFEEMNEVNARLKPGQEPAQGKPILLGVAAFALFASGSAFAQSTDFGDREPSVDEIVKELQSKPAEGVEGVQTRSLRPGAAVATKAAAPASASISLQVQFGFNSSQIEGGSDRKSTRLNSSH